MSKKLTENQKLFIDEYLKDRNATRAYKAAYPNVKKDTSAWVNASKLLSNTKVQEIIDVRLQKIHDRANIQAEDIRRELAKIGFLDIRKIFDEDGRIKQPEEWDEDLAAAISSVEVVTRNAGGGQVEYVHKIKTWDKKGSLELLGKELKMFTEKLDHSSSDGSMSPQQVDASKLSDEVLQELMDVRNNFKAE